MKNARRDFLRQTTAVVAAAGLFPGAALAAKNDSRGVAIVLGPREAAQKPARWAAEYFRDALKGRGAMAEVFASVEQTPPGFECVLVEDTQKANEPESVGLAWTTRSNRRVLLASGSDTRGLVYTLLDLADRVQFAARPIAELKEIKPSNEKPANKVRSIMRAFVSEVEDKPWFYDREMWPRYLTMLATQRFNRFNLSLGIGYDFLQKVTDAYFLFAYPFLLSVPGYNVRVPELPDSERDRNLEMLKFISEETVARGLQFQLGIWMHGYVWQNSPNPNYTIAGLTRETHGAYCRDAIGALLKACPAIGGVTLRIHGESGVAEGSYEFWNMVFEGVARAGRPVEIDLHAKGIDQTMIDSALATGLPVKIAPKFWAEHLGMPYHQAEIRENERPRPGKDGSGLMKLSSGSRSFLRYGYGDLLRGDRRYEVMHRIWPGTQRLLLWGDPLTAAAYSRAFSFCGSAGVEIMEPLTFKGRRGSGLAGNRCGYADASLAPRWDWEKYKQTLRVWGRCLYNPETDAEVFQREMRRDFGNNARAAEAALANASRILPIVTTAHGPSAANNTYWPEMYMNQSLIDPRAGPYDDTPSPRVFGNVSPFDPQLFSRVNECAAELLKGERSGKYSPIEVAQWIEDRAAAAAKHLATFDAPARPTPEFSRLVVDVRIQIALGKFFGAKFRAGVLYALFEQSGDRGALVKAIEIYRVARMAWEQGANYGRGVYQLDVTIGELPHLRGHWLDRLPAIDRDIAALEKKLAETASASSNDQVKSGIREALKRPHRLEVPAHHSPARSFSPGQPVDLDLAASKAMSVRLFYRHVNQGERWQSAEMAAGFRGTIPGAYTNSPFPLQYYFEIRRSPLEATLFPGFAPDLANQPYFVVTQTSARS